MSESRTKRVPVGREKTDSFDVMMTALRFNEKINNQDLAGLTELMTEDHTFIDKLGAVNKGKQVMTQGWRGFFNSYPDYRNVFTRVQMKEDDFVVMMGHSVC
jgi:ketosteroid isomerase-like protein